VAGSQFKPAAPKHGVFFNECYWCVQYQDKEIYFTFAQRGKAMAAHFSASREDLRLIKPAIEAFISWIFAEYPWCRMILATIKKPSVKRLVERVGFEHVTDSEGKSVYMRAR
jgi:hypothetical protein